MEIDATSCSMGLEKLKIYITSDLAKAAMLELYHSGGYGIVTYGFDDCSVKLHTYLDAESLARIAVKYGLLYDCTALAELLVGVAELDWRTAKLASERFADTVPFEFRQRAGRPEFWHLSFKVFHWIQNVLVYGSRFTPNTEGDISLIESCRRLLRYQRLRHTVLASDVRQISGVMRYLPNQQERPPEVPDAHLILYSLRPDQYPEALLPPHFDSLNAELRTVILNQGAEWLFSYPWGWGEKYLRGRGEKEWQSGKLDFGSNEPETLTVKLERLYRAFKRRQDPDILSLRPNVGVLGRILYYFFSLFGYRERRKHRQWQCDLQSQELRLKATEFDRLTKASHEAEGRYISALEGARHDEFIEAGISCLHCGLSLVIMVPPRPIGGERAQVIGEHACTACSGPLISTTSPDGRALVGMGHLVVGSQIELKNAREIRFEGTLVASEASSQKLVMVPLVVGPGPDGIPKLYRPEDLE